MFFFKKNNKSSDLNALYKKFYDNFSGKLSEEKKKELSDIVSKNGYYPSSFAGLELKNSEALFCLENIKHDLVFQKDADIKVINLGANSGFMDWVKQLIILPVGTIIYLTPMQERDFECAYFLKSYKVDKNLGTKDHIRLFIHLAHKTGHPVIYDFMTEFSRYAVPLIENPYLTRWIDVKYMEEKISGVINSTVSELEKDFDKDDLEIVKNIYLQESKGQLSEEYDKIYKIFDEKITEAKKDLSNEVYKYENQIKLQKRIKGNEKDLIEKGLWTIPCGADDIKGLPVFDYMNKEENYPIFKHFDYNGKDISETVKDDFKTPAYYKDLNNNKINKNVLKFFINKAKEYTEDYCFDGLKFNNLKNFCGDCANDKIPYEFLKKLNNEIKKTGAIIIADGVYDNFDKYQELGFDVIWTKKEQNTPQNILSKYAKLSNYNTEDLKAENLSSVRVYNDRFCELTESNPSKHGEKAAIFDWFCAKFLPAGKNLKISTLYMDGDESYTEKGFAKTLFQNAILERNNNADFYNKFKALNDFSSNTKLIKEGEATIIQEEKDGFVSWIISKEPLKEMILVAANYKKPAEKVILQNDNEKIETIKENDAVVNKMITLPGECRIKSEYIFDGNAYLPKDYKTETSLLEIEILEPSDFRIFLLRK